jgi:predicted TPR repeat methyltransferase
MTADSRGSTATGDFVLRLPDEVDKAADQDEEWCEVEQNGRRRRVRFHDYADIYSIPGLYERLIYEELRCESPRVIARLVENELARRGTDPGSLRVLDLGAGNGIVAEELADVGVRHLVGVDIIEAAATASERDRPGLYADYVVCDLMGCDERTQQRLRSERLNALTCVAALGFGDIPPDVFLEALRLVDTPALVAFTIKEAFLGDDDPSGFSELIDRFERDGTLQLLASERYQHRLSWAGEPLYYVAMLAEKTGDV